MESPYHVYHPNYQVRSRLETPLYDEQEWESDENSGDDLHQGFDHDAWDGEENENLYNEKEDVIESDIDEDEAEIADVRDFNLSLQRAQLENKLKLRFESIFEKYGKDFTGIGDEIDLRTGDIVVNNGHVRRMVDEHDLGDERQEQRTSQAFVASVDRISNTNAPDATRSVLQIDEQSNSEDCSAVEPSPSVWHDETETTIQSVLPSSKLPTEQQIMVQFGPQLGPQIIEYVAKRSILAHGVTEAAWQVPELPTTTDLRDPNIGLAVNECDVVERSPSPEVSVWAPVAPLMRIHGRKPRKTRTPYTIEEDEILVAWVNSWLKKGTSLWSRHIWSSLSAQYPRHTEGGWRDRYKKKFYSPNLIDDTDLAAEPTNSPTLQPRVGEPHDEVSVKTYESPRTIKSSSVQGTIRPNSSRPLRKRTTTVQLGKVSWLEAARVIEGTDPDLYAGLFEDSKDSNQPLKDPLHQSQRSLVVEDLDLVNDGSTWSEFPEDEWLAQTGMDESASQTPYRTVCSCQDDQGGDMIVCSGHNCRLKWFHLACVGLAQKPQTEWKCPACCSSDAVNSLDTSAPQSHPTNTTPSRVFDFTSDSSKSKLSSRTIPDSQPSPPNTFSSPRITASRLKSFAGKLVPDSQSSAGTPLSSYDALEAKLELPASSKAVHLLPAFDTVNPSYLFSDEEDDDTSEVTISQTTHEVSSHATRDMIFPMGKDTASLVQSTVPSPGHDGTPATKLSTRQRLGQSPEYSDRRQQVAKSPPRDFTTPRSQPHKRFDRVRAIQSTSRRISPPNNVMSAKVHTPSRSTKSARAIPPHLLALANEIDEFEFPDMEAISMMGRRDFQRENTPTCKAAKNTSYIHMSKVARRHLPDDVRLKSRSSPLGASNDTLKHIIHSSPLSSYPTADNCVDGLPEPPTALPSFVEPVVLVSNHEPRNTDISMQSIVSPLLQEPQRSGMPETSDDVATRDLQVVPTQMKRSRGGLRIKGVKVNWQAGTRLCDLSPGMEYEAYVTPNSAMKSRHTNPFKLIFKSVVLQPSSTTRDRSGLLKEHTPDFPAMKGATTSVPARPANRAAEEGVSKTIASPLLGLQDNGLSDGPTSSNKIEATRGLHEMEATTTCLEETPIAQKTSLEEINTSTKPSHDTSSVHTFQKEDDIKTRRKRKRDTDGQKRTRERDASQDLTSEFMYGSPTGSATSAFGAESERTRRRKRRSQLQLAEDLPSPGMVASWQQRT